MQLSPYNESKKHWHVPLFPQIPCPLHVVVGSQETNLKVKKVLDTFDYHRRYKYSRVSGTDLIIEYCKSKKLLEQLLA